MVGQKPGATPDKLVVTIHPSPPAKRGKGFTSGTRACGAVSAGGQTGAVLERRGEGPSSRVVALYALVAKAQLERIFHWEEPVRRAASAWLPRKLAEEFTKVRARR